MSRSLLLCCAVVLSACPAPERFCTPTTCPAGCCNADDRCVSASREACGEAGAVCLACAATESCVSGDCVPNATGGGGGAGGGGNVATGGGSATGGSGGGGDVEADAGVPDDAGVADAGVDAGVSRCTAAMPGFPADERFARERSTVDQPDDEPGAYQVHVVYVEPGDRTVAVPLDMRGDLRRSIEAGLNWYATETGSIAPRFDRCEGILDVTFLKMPATQPELAVAAGLDDTRTTGPAFARDRVGRFVTSQLTDPRKLYLVLWDGLAYARCGGAAWPPDIADHFTAMYRGGIFQATFLTSAVNVGATSLPVYSTSQLPLPAPPFDVTIDTETARVTNVSSNALTLSAPLTQAHVRLSTVRASSTTPDCRSTRMSPDGVQLGYFDVATMHEITHPLGIVARAAPDQVMSPWPAGHVGDTAQAGASDLMYTGASGWRCGGNASSPLTLDCDIDPAHRNYFRIPGATSRVDSSRSVFMTPLPPNAVTPPSW